MLKKRIGQIESRTFVGPREEKLTFEQLVAGYLQDYDLRGLRSKDTAELRAEHLKSFFDDDERALNITTERIRDYQLHRMGEKAQGATINREVAALRRMFTIAAKMGQLQSAPPFPDRLEENAPRQGFFEHNEYLAIRKHLPPDYADVLDFAYYTGWRKSEITELTWGEVDLLGHCLRLDPKRSKNKDGRVLPLVGPLWHVIERRVRCRRIETPHVFHYRAGRPVGNWRKTWKEACKRAGLPGKLLHDCRRTAARNLIRAGVPESIAMEITGHKTRAVFDRYNIVNEKDLAEAAIKLTNYVAGQPTEPEVVPVSPVVGEDPESSRTVFGQSDKMGATVSPQVVANNGGADETRTRGLRRCRPDSPPGDPLSARYSCACRHPY